MDKIAELESRLRTVESRNQKVESDKAWETSKTRRVIIALFTYFAIAIYLKFIVGIDPWINAITPTAGFLLSTFTLSYFKNIWQRFFYQK